MSRPQASFIWRKVVLVEKVNHLPKVNQASQCFRYLFLQNMANRLHQKQNAGMAKRVTRPARSPLCDNRVTLTTGSTFLHVNTPVCPVERTWSSQGEVISICEVFSSGKGVDISHINACSSWPAWVGGNFLFECYTINTHEHYLIQLEQKTRCRKES